MITQTTIDQVMSAARIEEVVGDYVPLHRRGGDFVGLCPFHEDHKPSMHVSISKGIYKCFACDEGGDAVRFLQKYLHVSWSEAILLLAKRYGIAVEYVPGTTGDDQASAQARQQAKEATMKRHQMMEVLNKAAGYFGRCLYLPKHGEVLKYLHERGISDATLRVYRVGYAPREQQGRGLLEAAIKAGYDGELLVDAGLALSPSKARFINRIVFPIVRVDGCAVGFGGRILPSEPDKKALAIKYLNTCETMLYQKSKVLFGLDIARTAITQQKRAYICEGYMDVLALHEAGIHQAVAACGTAFTTEQGRLLSRFCTSAVLCYDGDAAGAKATVSTMKILLSEGVIPEVLVSPLGSDPATLWQEHGADLPQYIAQHTVSYLEYLVGNCTVSSSPAAYQTMMTRATQVIACVRDALVRDQAIRWVANSTESKSAIVEQMVRTHGATPGQGRHTEVSSIDEPISNVLLPTPRPAIEKSIVALLTAHPYKDFLHFAREEIIDDGITLSSVDMAEVVRELESARGTAEGGSMDGSLDASMNASLNASMDADTVEQLSRMLEDLVLALKECVVLERMQQAGSDWEMLGEMKAKLEGRG